MTNLEDIKKLVGEITDFVNSYTADEQQFIAQMSTEHRTLQQSFTRLVLKWLQFCASIDYRYDDRNKATHDTAKRLIEAFRKNSGNIDPSDFLPFI
jgi:hypothetical protein